MTKAQILSALAAFVAQRPGLEFGNYGNVSAYRSEMRAITRDRHDFNALTAYVARRDSITADNLKECFRAFSGRLSLSETPEGGARLDYCTGQYFPTEYRKAACAVLGTAIFYRMRADLEEAGKLGSDVERPGDAIRKAARREIGARLQRRWVD